MSLYDLVITAIVSIACFLGVTLIAERRQSPFRQEFLGISLIIIGLTFAYIVFNSTGLLYRFPFLIRLLSPFMYLVGPLFYLYVATALRKEPHLKALDYLHFLPALFHFVELMPFYLLDSESKRNLAFSIQSDINVLFRKGEGLIPITYHYALRVLLLFVYGGVIFQKLHSPSDKDVKILNEIRPVGRFYYGLVLILCSIYLFGLGYFPPNLEKYGSLFFLMVMALLLLTGFGMLFVRKIRWSGDLLLPAETVHVEKENTGTEWVCPFSEEEVKRLRERIRLYFEEGAYRNPKLRIKDLAHHLDIQERDLNPLIQESFGMKFNDLLKKYRVEESKRLIGQDTNGTWTMEGLGAEAGFSSRSSFFMVFKELTGLTPKQYKDSML